MADDKAKAKKTKRPTALKRDIQNEKKRMNNKRFKSKISTALRSFHSSLESKDDTLSQKLCSVYSLVDKAVKKGIYKKNKAARVKSRLSAKIS